MELLAGGALVSSAPTKQTERVFPQNTRNTQNRLAEICRPQIGTDAHRLGRYGIPVIPTPPTEQTTNTGSANRRRLRHSCRSHSNMTYSSSRQLAMPTKNISHGTRRAHRKAGCGDSSGGIPADAASKNISLRTRRAHRKAGCRTAHRTHSCCGGGRRPPLLTKRTQTSANSEFGEKHALTFCVDPILLDHIPSKRFCEFREFCGTTS